MQNRWSVLVLSLGVFLFLGWGLVRAVQAIRFTQDIGGHLKLAADANSTAIAEKQLRIVTKAMDKWGLCNEIQDDDADADCYTSVWWSTPDEDVAFWRENIEATLADLEGMSPEERSNNLVESNQLLKVRETLLDSTNKGDRITAPDGISVYPYNALLGWLGFLGVVLSSVGGVSLWLRTFGPY